jgi:hypothetical protein
VMAVAQRRKTQFSDGAKSWMTPSMATSHQVSTIIHFVDQNCCELLSTATNLRRVVDFLGLGKPWLGKEETAAEALDL